MLSSIPNRASLSVAPLSIQKGGTATADDDDYLDAIHRTTSSASTLTASNAYAQAHMTPPATPNGSQEDLYRAQRRSQIYSYVDADGRSYTDSLLLSQPDPPPVFHSFLRAYYAFQPSYSPADSTVTLPMNEGDVILVHSIHTNGWADGTLLVSGARGWLPTNYCDAYEPEEMRNLLMALLTFWDLMRSTTVNDSEIFGNQEFMKGIIAGVRYLLERTQCLTRESPLVQRHDGLRRGRKSLLSELSALVKSAKRLQEYQRFPTSTENVNDIIDEMILKAFKIVIKAVRFFDVLEDDRRQRAPSVAVMATVLEENNIPPTPPADNVTFDDQKKPLTTSVSAPAAVDVTSTNTVTSPVSAKRISSSTMNYPRRMSQTNPAVGNRLSSSSISHRVSLAGPSPLSEPHNLVSHRLSDRHDTFLSFLGSFIGRLHLQAQSRPHLALAIKQSATSGGQLLVVVDIVSGHDSLSREILQQSRSAMSDRIVELVYLARDILTNQSPDVEDVIMPQDNGRLLMAATDCVKATGECVAKTKWVIERIGDFEYEFNDATLAFDLDLSVFDVATESEAHGDALRDSAGNAPSNPSIRGDASSIDENASGAASISDSTSSSSSGAHHRDESTADSEYTAVSTQEDSMPPVSVSSPTPTAESPLNTAASTPVTRTTILSIDKPLPEVPQITSPAEEQQQVTFYSGLSISQPSSLAVTDVALGSSARPTLPPLPRLSTLMPNDGFGSNEQASGTDSELTASFRSDTLTAVSSGTATSRDSESSLISQTSTRATTPDHTLVPQLSISELSTAASSTMVEEAEEEVESKLLERTYAHELMFNKEGQVTGGSLPALVERLTTHESTPDAMFVSTFYLTFRLFCTPIKLADALIDRFDYVGESPHMANPVRLRVYNAFKGWLESHWRDETDHEALSLIEPFAEYRLSSVLPSAGRRLLELTQRVTSSDGTLVPRLVSSMGKTNTSISQYVPVDTPLPVPVVSKSLHHGLANWKMGGTIPTVMDFDPLEMARQLTIRQMNIFSSIMPEELLGSQWMKKGGVNSPNVKAMTALSTDLSNLVAGTILMYHEVKKRAAVIKQWIKIAQQCFELHNYDSLMAIICSLNSSTITRLRRTWDVVSPRRRETLKTLQAIVEPAQNNKVLRGRLHDHVPPCLPFLGMYLTDLTFVDIGNPATKQLPGQDGSDQNGNGDSGHGLTVVNFDKHTRTAKIIGELQRFQIPYRLTEMPDIQEWIGEQISKVREMEKTPGDNVQVSYYRKSLLLEPRETQMLKSVVDAGTTAVVPATPSIKEPSPNLFAWMRVGTGEHN